MKNKNYSEKPTAIDWLENQLLNLVPFNTAEIRKEYRRKFEQTKQMEKEQIEHAHIEGQRVFDKYPHTQWTNDQAEQYYIRTYEN